MTREIPTPRPANSPLAVLARIEENFLCLCLVVMILIACIQILLRTLFASGMSWADPFLRHLVIWSGFLGAARATSQGKHIALDIITFLVPQSMHPWLQAITNLFSSIVAGFLTWAAYLFIKNEITFNSTELLSVPSWIWNLIFPISFALISLRFLLSSITNVRKVLSNKEGAGNL
jgi:TRAP-type C4-dicarboxylate transport system permease small subunit